MIDRSLFLSADGLTYDSIHPVPSEEITQLMLELADLKPGEKVLEIGTGSGYQTAFWAETGAEVFTIDPHEPRHGLISNVCWMRGDGRNGWPYPEEFDCILITCGMESVPPPLISQLKEQGRLIAPIGNSAGQELRKYILSNGELRLDRIGAYTRFVMCED